ncbi:hypothetical protein Dda_2538 [Drechslerella dactyloides]|uniref:Uncharacterized protein n=1 Tax=Drechslerella dactyloides TaxID=74499 RepID=A0AAD6J169_DREDA|nr:hypothetical protein Dda_2538 [Drechslerella dactyloides]
MVAISKYLALLTGLAAIIPAATIPSSHSRTALRLRAAPQEGRLPSPQPPSPASPADARAKRWHWGEYAGTRTISSGNNVHGKPTSRIRIVYPTQDLRTSGQLHGAKNPPRKQKGGTDLKVILIPSCVGGAILLLCFFAWCKMWRRGKVAARARNAQAAIAGQSSTAPTTVVAPPTYQQATTVRVPVQPASGFRPYSPRALQWFGQSWAPMEQVRHWG